MLQAQPSMVPVWLAVLQAWLAELPVWWPASPVWSSVAPVSLAGENFPRGGCSRTIRGGSWALGAIRFASRHRSGEFSE